METFCIVASRMLVAAQQRLMKTYVYNTFVLHKCDNSTSILNKNVLTLKKLTLVPTGLGNAEDVACR